MKIRILALAVLSSMLITETVLPVQPADDEPAVASDDGGADQAGVDQSGADQAAGDDQAATDQVNQGDAGAQATDQGDQATPDQGTPDQGDVGAQATDQGDQGQAAEASAQDGAQQPAEVQGEQPAQGDQAEQPAAGEEGDAAAATPSTPALPSAVTKAATAATSQAAQVVTVQASQVADKAGAIDKVKKFLLAAYDMFRNFLDQANYDADSFALQYGAPTEFAMVYKIPFKGAGFDTYPVEKGFPAITVSFLPPMMGPLKTDAAIKLAMSLAGPVKDVFNSMSRVRGDTLFFIKTILLFKSVAKDKTLDATASLLKIATEMNMLLARLAYTLDEDATMQLQGISDPSLIDLKDPKKVVYCKGPADIVHRMLTLFHLESLENEITETVSYNDYMEWKERAGKGPSDLEKAVGGIFMTKGYDAQVQAATSMLVPMITKKLDYTDRALVVEALQFMAQNVMIIPPSKLLKAKTDKDKELIVGNVLKLRIPKVKTLLQNVLNNMKKVGTFDATQIAAINTLLTQVNPTTPAASAKLVTDAVKKPVPTHEVIVQHIPNDGSSDDSDDNKPLSKRFKYDQKKAATQTAPRPAPNPTSPVIDTNKPKSTTGKHHCIKCKNKFSLKMDLVKHINRHYQPAAGVVVDPTLQSQANRAKKCLWCETSIDNANEYISHVNAEHLVDQSAPQSTSASSESITFFCPTCSKACRTQLIFKQHRCQK